MSDPLAALKAAAAKQDISKVVTAETIETATQEPIVNDQTLQTNQPKVVEALPKTTAQVNEPAKHPQPNEPAINETLTKVVTAETNEDGSQPKHTSTFSLRKGATLNVPFMSKTQGSIVIEFRDGHVNLEQALAVEFRWELRRNQNLGRMVFEIQSDSPEAQAVVKEHQATRIRQNSGTRGAQGTVSGDETGGFHQPAMRNSMNPELQRQMNNHDMQTKLATAAANRT